MDEREFVRRAEDELAAVDRALGDTEDLPLDWQLTDGVLTLELQAGGKIIVSLNRPVREIWVAAGAQGLHFGLDAQGQWRTSKGQELHATLSQLVSERTGTPVKL